MYVYNKRIFDCFKIHYMLNPKSNVGTRAVVPSYYEKVVSAASYVFDGIKAEYSEEERFSSIL